MASKLFFGAVVLLSLSTALAQTNSPGFVPFQALVTDSSTGQPELNTTISTFTIEVLDGVSSCALYKETFNNIATDDKGLVALSLGTGTKSTASGAPTTFQRIFNNNITINSLGCLAGGTPNATALTLSASTGRKIQFSVDNGSTWSPAISIGSVPYAFHADDSTTLGGLASSAFIQASGNVTQSNLATLTGGSSTDASTLHNHDSRYARLGTSGTQNFGSSNLTTSGKVFIGSGSTSVLADVDIEKTAPSLRLAATGSTGQSSTLDFYGGGASRASIQSRDNSNSLYFYTGGTQAMQLDSSQNVTFAGSASVGGSLSVSGVLGVGRYTSAQETALLGALTSSNEGVIWENSTTHAIKYWNGTAAQTLSTGSGGSGITSLNGQTASSQTFSSAAPNILISSTGGVHTFAWSGVLATSRGGTGASLVLSPGAIIYAGSTGVLAVSSVGTAGQVLTSNGSGAPTWTTVSGAGTSDATKLSLSGGTMTGALILASDPTATLGAATKQYVDAVAAGGGTGYVKADGTVPLTSNWNVAGFKIGNLGTPTSGTDAATKSYVDSVASGGSISGYVKADGSIPMTANWTFGGFRISNLGVPTAAYDAVTKNYADGYIGARAISAVAPTVNQVLQWNGSSWGPATISGGGSGITSLNGLTSASQTFSSTAANIAISSTGSAHTFAWTGNLAMSRGGTGSALTASAGAVAYSNSSGLALLAPGTAGQVLTSNGTGTPYWQTLSGGSTSDPTKLSLSGGTMTGSLILASDPTAALGAVTKQYVDAVAAGGGTGYVKSDGTVPLTSNWNVGGYKLSNLATPTSGTDAVNKSYVDSVVTGGSITGYVKADGSVPMTANWTFGGYRLMNLAAPTSSLDAVNKTYADGYLGGRAISAIVPSANQVLQWNGSQWVPATVSGGGGSGLTSLNGLTSTTQTFASNLSNLSVSSAGSVHTLAWSGALPGNRGGTGATLTLTPGAIIYANSTGVMAVSAVGTAGQVLTSNGSGAPTWTTVSGAGTSDPTKLPLAGGTMTGALILAADPTAALGAATKQYADKFVPLAGATMTGILSLSSDPINNMDAATKEYVDAVAINTTGNFVPKSGDSTITGSLTVNGSVASWYLDNTGATTADFYYGNVQVSDCQGSSIDLTDLTPGGQYVYICQNAAPTTYTFNYLDDNTATVKYLNHGPTTSGADTFFYITRVGIVSPVIYVKQEAGYQ